MNFTAMNLFLSEENISKHLEFLRTQRLRLSILEKSIPALKGKAPLDIFKMRLDKDVKNETLNLLSNILSHESFFSSFTENVYTGSRGVKPDINCDKLVYDIYTEAMKNESGFLYITKDNGQIRIRHSNESNIPFISICPLLSLDLYEHAYFWDYGFNKDLYVKNALKQIDLSKLY